MTVTSAQLPADIGTFSTAVSSSDTVKSREKSTNATRVELPTNMLSAADSARPHDSTSILIDKLLFDVKSELSILGKETEEVPSEAQKLFQEQEKTLDESKGNGGFDIEKFANSSHAQISQLLSHFFGDMQKSLVQMRESSAQFKIARMDLNNKSLDLQREAARKDFTSTITQATVSLAGSAVMAGKAVRSQIQAEKQLNQINTIKNDSLGLADHTQRQKVLENAAQHSQRTMMNYSTNMSVTQLLSQVPGVLGQAISAQGRYEAESLRINSQQQTKEAENVNTIVQNLVTLTESINKAVEGLMQGNAQIYQSLAQQSRLN